MDESEFFVFKDKMTGHYLTAELEEGNGYRYYLTKYVLSAKRYHGTFDSLTHFIEHKKVFDEVPTVNWENLVPYKITVSEEKAI